jgi:hypothetical protein
VRNVSGASLVIMRASVAIVAGAALAVTAAGCGASAGSHVAQLGTTEPVTSPRSGTSSSSGANAGLEFSSCMRSHGVAKFPDLTESSRIASQLPKLTVSLQQLGVTSTAFQSAERACRHLLPQGGRTPSESQRDLNAMRGFARCMRAHGVPTWPDPMNGPAGWGFDLVNVQGFDPNSPQIDQKMTVCQRQLHGGFGIPLSRPGGPG